MTVLALANLGVRDIARKDEGNPRPVDSSEWDSDELLKENLDLPIIRPFLEAVRNYSGETPLLVLFATKQVNANNQIARRDTHRLLTPIKTLLSQDSGPFGHLTRGLAISQCIPENPHDYDAMLSWYDKVLPETMEHLRLPPRTPLHVSITAGTPAMNTALMLRAYGSGTVHGVWHVGEDTGRARQLGVGQILAGNPFRTAIEQLLERGDFDGAARVAENLQPQWTAATMKAMGMTRRCDFASANNLLREIAAEDPRVLKRENLFKRFLVWTEELQTGQKMMKREKLLDEGKIIDGIRAVHGLLLEELELCIYRGDYPEALAVLYRLQESLCRIDFERTTNGPSGGTGNMKKITAEVRKAAESVHINTKNLYSPMAIVRKTVIEKPSNRNLKRWIIRLLKGSKGIMSLRHDSRVGHGFSPVTEKDIRKRGWESGTELIEESRRITRDLLGSLQKPRYPEVRELVLRSLFPDA